MHDRLHMPEKYAKVNSLNGEILSRKEERSEAAGQDRYPFHCMTHGGTADYVPSEPCHNEQSRRNVLGAPGWKRTKKKKYDGAGGQGRWDGLLLFPHASLGCATPDAVISCQETCL